MNANIAGLSVRMPLSVTSAGTRPLGLDSQVLGSSLLIRGEVDANRGILSTRLFQRDVGGK
jgi:hypothetical protein